MGRKMQGAGHSGALFLQMSRNKDCPANDYRISWVLNNRAKILLRFNQYLRVDFTFADPHHRPDKLC